MIKVLVNGAKGRMGRAIVQLIQKDKNFALAGAIDFENAASMGIISKMADVIIDFSSPGALQTLLETPGKPLVIGTTGHDEKQRAKIKKAAETTPILVSPNMSVGVNLMYKLTEMATSILKDYNIELLERHHIHKKDAPSGTAKKIIEVISKVLPKANDSIDVKSIREGEIVGEHELFFDNGFERVGIIHHAKTRDLFAIGALRAAQWIVDKKPGLYDMQDVLFKT